MRGEKTINPVVMQCELVNNSQAGKKDSLSHDQGQNRSPGFAEGIEERIPRQ